MIWKCTCRACPEQYDIYKERINSEILLPVAYFRVRHGNLYVHPYKNGEIDWSTTIYEKHYDDERGWFSKEGKELIEFNTIIRIINFKIYCYLIKQWFKKLWN